jgi:hypothetical protein
MKEQKMKMKHSALLAIIATIVGLSLTTACSMPSASKPVSSSSSSGLVTLGLSVSKASARTISVDYAALRPAKYELFGAVSGGSVNSLGSWDSLAVVEGASSATIRLAPGTYDFSLDAYDGNGKLILEGTLDSQVISAAGTLNFTLYGIKTSGTGTVSVALSWPKSSAVASVTAKFGSSDAVVIPSSTWIASEASANGDGIARYSASYVNASASVGNQKLVFALLDANGKVLATIVELAQVRLNLSSTKSIDVLATELNGPPILPSAASISAGSAGSGASALIGWTAASSNTSSYELQYSTDGSSWTALASIAAGTLCYTDSSITDKESCYYRVRAINDFGATEYWQSDKYTAAYISPAEKKLPSATAAVGSAYGISTAVYGDYAIVGAPLDATNSSGLSNAGSAYIYERDSSGSWKLATKLYAPTPTATEYFGVSVAIAGNWAFVGTCNQTAFGKVYVYSRTSDGTWAYSATLTSGATGIDSFGFALAASGTNLIVGACAAAQEGAVYIFSLLNGTWIESVKLEAPSDAYYFGYHVLTISSDYAVVGATGTSLDGINSNGAAKVYVYKYSSGTWGSPVELNSLSATENSQFGSGGSISISGSRIAVGVPGASSAFVYTLDSSGNWTQSAALSKDSEFFGISVAIEGDSLVVGNPGCTIGDSNDVGAVHIFTYDSTNRWTEKDSLVPTNNLAYGTFGYSVSLTDSYLVVGAPSLADENARTQPAAYVFEL